MPKQLHYAIVLFIIAGACVAGINAVYSLSKENIEKERRNAKLRGVRVAFGYDGDDASVEIKSEKCADSAGNDREIFACEKGFAVEDKAEGYSSKVRVITAVDAEITKLVGVSVIYQAETPGFGAKVVDVPPRETWITLIFGGGPEGEPTLEEKRPVYQRGYYGLDIGKLKPDKVKQAEKQGGVDAISGATITSQALYDAVRNAVSTLKYLRKENKLPRIE